MMLPTYLIHFSAQLRQHLRALRKRRGLTQAQLGALIGVTQARIAEIEAAPGIVGFEQLLHLFSALGVTVALQEQGSDHESDHDMAIPLDQAVDVTTSRTQQHTKATASDKICTPKHRDDDIATTPGRPASVKKGMW